MAHVRGRCDSCQLSVVVIVCVAIVQFLVFPLILQQNYLQQFPATIVDVDGYSLLSPRYLKAKSQHHMLFDRLSPRYRLLLHAVKVTVKVNEQQSTIEKPFVDLDLIKSNQIKQEIQKKGVLSNDDDDNNHELHLTNNSTRTNKNKEEWSYRTLDDDTSRLLNSAPVGEWGPQSFRDVEQIVAAWSTKQSRRAALEMERLLQRVIQEQRDDNPYADAVDMTMLYTHLIIGWANSGEMGGPERAEEILIYFQRISEEVDCYDPLLCGPCIESINAVIAAYANSGKPDAPQQATRILGMLYEWIQKGRTVVTPNKESYAHVLRAYAQNSSPESPALVRRLIEHMESLSTMYPSVQPDYSCHNVYIFAVNEAMNRGHIHNIDGAILTQQYLEMMLSRSNDTLVAPDKWTFNMVLNAWSKSGSPDMVERAELVMTMMEEYHNQCGCTMKTAPNANTYNTLLSCYSRCSKLPDKADRAHSLLQKMKQLYHSGTNLHAQPDAITYNIVMNLCAKTGRRTSPLKVEELLREMTQAYVVSGDRKLRPTTRTINTCLDAWAKSGHEDADERILEWLNKMRDAEDFLATGSNSLLRPDKWTYNAYLQALARSSKKDIGTTAEDILLEMETLHQQGHTYDVKPDVLTYTNVIHCIALSGQENAVDRALTLLNRLEDLHEKGSGDVRPNLFTYNCVINTIAKSKRAGKAQLALSILNRIEEVALRPVTVSYNNVLNACAFSQMDVDDPNAILQIALDVLRAAQSGPGANWITYQTAIRVVCCCVIDRDERWNLTKRMFRECCQDGQCTRTVLTQVRYGVTSGQYTMLENEVLDPTTQRLRDDYCVNAKLSMRSRTTKIVST